MIDLRLTGDLERLTGHSSIWMPVDTPRKAFRGLARRWPRVIEVIEVLDWTMRADGERVGLHTKLSDGAVIELEPVFGGAGVVAVAVKAVVSFVGAGNLALLGVGIAASAISSAIARNLSPNPEPDFMLQENPEDRTSYLFGRLGNLQRAGQVVPIVYGEIRCGGVQITQFTEIEDTTETGLDGIRALSSVTRLVSLDVVSEGEIDGLAQGDGKSIYFDGVPLLEQDQSPNFGDATWFGLVGEDPNQTPYQAGIPQRQIGVSQRIIKLDPADYTVGAVERSVTDLNVTHFRGVMRFPQLWSTHANGSLIENRVDLGVEVSDKDGIWTRPTYDISNLLWDQQGAATDNTSWSTTTANVTRIRHVVITWLFDEADGGPVGNQYSIDMYHTPPGQAEVWNIVTVDRPAEPKFVYGGIPLYEYVFEVEVGGMPEGTVLCRTADPGGLIVNGTRTLYTSGTHLIVDGFTTTPYEVDMLLDLTQHGVGPWTVRVWRDTDEDDDTGTARSESYWDRYSELFDVQLQYNKTAMVGTTVSSEETGGGVPQRSYVIRGRLVQVPHGYDPLAAGDPWAAVVPTWPAAASPVWETDRMWSNNPALCLYDMLTFEGGLSLTESQVDLFSLADAARYCDGLVDDGDGGTERRFLFDHQFTTAADALKVVTTLASTMNAQVWWGEGQVFITQDRPTTASRAFGPANAIDGILEYSSVSRRDHYSEATCAYKDKTRDYANALDRETRTWLIDRYGEHVLSQQALGCTRWSQARRRNRYVLEGGETEDQLLAFRTGAEGMLLTPGEVIQVSDPYWEPIRATGRTTTDINGPGATNVNIDFAFDFDPLKDYVISVMDLDVQLAVHDVANPGISTRLVPLQTPMVNGHGGHAMWIITESGSMPPREFRVLEVSETDLMNFEVRATLHDDTKYTRIEDLSAVDPGWPYPL